MNRPTKKKNIAIRVTDKQKTDLKNQALSLGITLSHYVLSMALKPTAIEKR